MNINSLSMESGRAFELLRGQVADLRNHRDTDLFRTLVTWVETQILHKQASMLDCKPETLPVLQAQLQVLMDQRRQLTNPHPAFP